MEEEAAVVEVVARLVEGVSSRTARITLAHGAHSSADVNDVPGHNN